MKFVKVNNRDIRMTDADVFIVNFEHFSHLFFSVSMADFKQIVVYGESKKWCFNKTYVFKFEHISHLVLVFLLLTLSR